VRTLAIKFMKEGGELSLVSMKISVYTLAQAIKVPRSMVNNIVLGPRGVAADTAFRLARSASSSLPYRHNPAKDYRRRPPRQRRNVVETF
jgi:hypothetical protein